MDKPTAEQFREMFSEALEDPRKPEIQLKYLDQVFEQEAKYLQQDVEDSLAEIYEQLSGLKRDPYFEEYAHEDPKFVGKWNQKVFNAVARKSPDERNEAFIVGLTNGSIDPVFNIRLKVNPAFTDFSDIGIEDLPSVTELPGYIKLHEAARAMDVGIAVVGLTGGEGAGQPALIIDLKKTYEQGVLIRGGLNPPVQPEPEEEDIPAATPSRRNLKPGLKIFTM